MTTLTLEGITVTHGEVTVLDDVDLVVPRASVTALLGASGSGKTTTLRAVAGLVAPDAGRVLLGDADVTGMPTRDRRLSYVPQGAPLLPHRDLAENVAFPLRLHGTERVEAIDIAEQHGRAFGLRRLRGRHVKQLSSGEQAAVGIARGTVRPPRVLLLDEPVPHIDPQARAHVLARIETFQQLHSVTVLVATNDVRVAEVLADQVAVIDRARIVSRGPLQDVRDAPGTMTSADLVAPAPLRWLPAVVRSGPRDRERAIDTGGGQVVTGDPAVRGHDGRVMLGVGPRDAVLSTAGTGSLTGRVRRVATTGARRLVTVATAGGDVVVDTAEDLSWLPHDDRVDVDVRRALVADEHGDVIATLDLSHR